MKELVKKLSKIKRINAKVDLSFWAIKPYTETINYIIDGGVYNPVSYRFLFVALIVVYQDDFMQNSVPKDVAKAFNPKNKHD